MRLTVCCLTLLVAAGCSAGPARPTAGGGPTTADALDEVVGMIRNHTAQFNRGPAKAADLSRYATEFPLGWKALQAGDIVVVPGGTVAGEGGGGGAGAVVAYEKSAAESGGAVALDTGAVKQMTAAEFNAAPKAGKK